MLKEDRVVERTERVVLELVDRFSGPMARAATATEATSRALHDLDGTSTSAARSQDNLSRSTARVTTTLRQSSAATSTAAASTSTLAQARARAATASNALEAATRREANAAGSLRVAQASLNDLRERGNASATRLLAAEERVAAATRNHASAAEALRRAQVRANETTAAVSRVQREAAQAVTSASSAFQRGRADIDSYSGRLNLLATAAVGLGPALLPITAAAVPAVTGLAAGLGAVAGGVGTMMLAFHGVGDAFKALNDYQLDPTVENLAKMQQAMNQIGPAGEQFVRYIDSLSGDLTELQRIAQANMFPGLEDGIKSLITLMPQAREIVARLSAEVGDLGRSMGDSLAHDADWQRFFDYLKTDAAPTLSAFARATGNLAAGLANVLVAFQPLSRGFTTGLLDMSRSFRDWTANTNNFQGFIDYVQSVGPHVREFFSALVDAIAGLAHAAAPFGSAVLPVLTTVAKVFATIADSPIGPTLYTAAAAMLVFGKASTAFTTLGGRVATAQTSLTGFGRSLRTLRSDMALVGRNWNTAGPWSPQFLAAQGRAQTAMRGLGTAAKAAAGVGGMMLLSDAATQTNKSVQVLEDVAGGAAAGLATGSPWGVAIGGATGLLLGFADSNKKAAEASGDLLATMNQQTGAFTDASAKWVASQFSDEDLQALHKYGVGIDEVANAVLTGGKTLDDFKNKRLGAIFDEVDGDKQLYGAYKDIDKIAGNVTATQRQFAAQAEATGGALDGEADSTDRAAEAARTAAASLKSYIDQQNKLHEATLANIDKQTAFGQALHDAQVQARKGTDGFSAFTKAGRANRTAMSQLIGAYNDQSQAVKNSVKGYRNVKAEVTNLGHQMHLSKAQIDALTDAIDKPKKLEISDEEAQQRIKAIQRLVDTYGLTKAQAKALLEDNASGKIHSVQQLVDKYGLSKKTATALLNDLASGKLSSILSLINSLHDKTVTVRLNHITENSVITHYSNTFSGSSNNPPNRTPGAMGMILRGDRKTFARGGVDKANAHEAEIAAGATPYRVWAEPETQGEAYIPFANDHRRPRARRILEYTADQLGGDVTWHANGGIVQRFASGGYAHASQGTHNALTPAERRDQRLIDAIKRVSDRADRLTKSVDKARNRVDAWTDKQDQLASTIRSSLTLDAFGGSTSWNDTNQAGSLGSWRATERTQRSNAQALAKDIAKLRKDGASDEFISYILSQQDPVSVAHMFASETKAQVRSDQSLYASATRAVSTTANAGGAIYNNEIRESNQQLAHVRAELKQANQHLKQLRAEEKKAHAEAQDQRKKQPHETAKAISKPAAKGKRDAR